MPEHPTPQLSKAPFWFADLTLLGAACVLVALGPRPLGIWECLAVTVCVGLGAWLAVVPFLRQYDAELKGNETQRLADTTAKLGELESIADQISGATGQWQGVQESARQTAETAKGVVERLAREAEAFATAVSRTADSEKQTMKLEVDKMRRAEGEWLQAVGRIMDHVFALHVAAVKSAQPGVADQLDRFHGACRDALRRVGFTPLVAAPDEVFDPRKHQPVDGVRPPEGARVDETVAPGYVYQGQLIRPIVVRIVGAVPVVPGGENAPAPASEEAAGGVGAS